MAVKGSASVTIFKERVLESTTPYYKSQSSTANPPAKPTTNPPSGWTKTEPVFVESSTNTLYQTILFVYSDGSFEYSDVGVYSSFEAAKSAYNKALSVQDDVNQHKAHFWHDSEGAHVLSDVNGYRTDLNGNGMDILDTSDENRVIASFQNDLIELANERFSITVTEEDDDNLNVVTQQAKAARGASVLRLYNLSHDADADVAFELYPESIVATINAEGVGDKVEARLTDDRGHIIFYDLVEGPIVLGRIDFNKNGIKINQKAVVLEDDARLTDARTPKSHNHDDRYCYIVDEYDDTRNWHVVKWSNGYADAYRIISRAGQTFPNGTSPMFYNSSSDDNWATAKKKDSDDALFIDKPYISAVAESDTGAHMVWAIPKAVTATAFGLIYVRCVKTTAALDMYIHVHCRGRWK